MTPKDFDVRLPCHTPPTHTNIIAYPIYLFSATLSQLRMLLPGEGNQHMSRSSRSLRNATCLPGFQKNSGHEIAADVITSIVNPIVVVTTGLPEISFTLIRPVVCNLRDNEADPYFADSRVRKSVGILSKPISFRFELETVGHGGSRHAGPKKASQCYEGNGTGDVDVCLRLHRRSRIRPKRV